MSDMTDDEWEKQRARAVLAAFQTGRPVFADTDGELRYADGSGERLPDHAGVPQTPLPGATVEVTWWERFKRRIGRRSL